MRPVFISLGTWLQPNLGLLGQDWDRQLLRERLAAADGEHVTGDLAEPAYQDQGNTAKVQEAFLVNFLGFANWWSTSEILSANVFCVASTYFLKYEFEYRPTGKVLYFVTVLHTSFHFILSLLPSFAPCHAPVSIRVCDFGETGDRVCWEMQWHHHSEGPAYLSVAPAR